MIKISIDKINVHPDAELIDISDDSAILIQFVYSNLFT